LEGWEDKSRKSPPRDGAEISYKISRLFPSKSRLSEDKARSLNFDSPPSKEQDLTHFLLRK